MNPVAIVQARQTSSRLPNKVMAPLGKEPMIWHVMRRVQRSNVNKVVLAIPDTPENDELAEYANKNQWPLYRGSEEDVLSRYFWAALEFGADTIVRVTADCPLVDPGIINAMLDIYDDGEFEYVCNNMERTFALGLDVEVFSREALALAHECARNEYDREHVTPLMRDNYRDMFRIGNLSGPGGSFADLRLTVDTQTDLTLMQEIFFALGRKSFITTADVLWLLDHRPDLMERAFGVVH